MRSSRVYTASKIRHAALWRQLRAQWHSHPYYVQFTARWIDQVAGEGSPDFSDTLHFTSNQIRLGWIQNIQDVCYSDWVITYLEPEDAVKGTLVEVGAGIARGLPILAVGYDHHHSWQSHPLVSKFPDLQSAFQFITGQLR